MAALYRGRPDFDVAALVDELVEAESVPFLPVLRYKPTGLRKRQVWERTWDLQRREDAGEDVGRDPGAAQVRHGGLPEDRHLAAAGQARRAQGALDQLPALLRPTATRRSSSAGPAGTTSSRRRPWPPTTTPEDARAGPPSASTPLLAGLDQLLPWLHQWHHEIDPEFGQTDGRRTTPTSVSRRGPRAWGTPWTIRDVGAPGEGQAGDAGEEEVTMRGDSDQRTARPPRPGPPGDFVLNLSEGVTEPDADARTTTSSRPARRLLRQRPGVHPFGRRGAQQQGGLPARQLRRRQEPLHGGAAPALAARPRRARRSEDLAEVCVKHGWVQGKKFLLVPYHMIGARDMESAILGGYADHVCSSTPTPPGRASTWPTTSSTTPSSSGGVLGDEKFFAQNQARGPRRVEAGASRRGWNAARFDAAVAAPPGDEERGRLVGDLVQYLFPAYQGVAGGKAESFRRSTRA